MIARLIRFILSAVFFLMLSVILLLAAALLAARAPGVLQEPRVVTIESGMGTRTVAATLENQGIIKHRYLFLISAVLSGRQGRVQAGEYQFMPHISVFQVVEQMVAGRVYQRKLTIPEGLTVHEIIELVSKAEGLTGVVSSRPDEGTMLPETYLYTRGETREKMIKRMVTAMDQTMAGLWAARPSYFSLTTPLQVLTLASVVEKETGVAGERPRVAGVFFNRLRLGMKLQSDPTVIYALTEGKGALGRPLLLKDLEQTRSPYNTYLYPGLPPGPIANPGLASLRAVMAPAQTDELYFVANGTGGHAFARTLDEHNANVARWRLINRVNP